MMICWNGARLITQGMYIYMYIQLYQAGRYGNRKITTDQRWKSILKTKFCTQKKTLHWKHAPQHKITCRPHHLHIHSILIQGTPTKLTKPFRLTSLMNCQRLEAYACRPKFVSTQSLLVKNSMSCQRDFDDFQFQEPQMDFGLLRSWVASSTLAILLPNEPLPKNNLQKTFPRFNFNKFQPIQTGSLVLTILRFQFHVCRPHLHSCLGSWHLPTRKRHISSPFFLDGLPIEVVRFSTDHQRSCKSQGDKNLEILRSPILSASQQQSRWKQTFQRNEHHGKLTKSKPFSPIPIDPYMKQLLWNIELKSLGFFFNPPSNNIYSRKYGILQHSSQPASSSSTFCKTRNAPRSLWP